MYEEEDYSVFPKEKTKKEKFDKMLDIFALIAYILVFIGALYFIFVAI